MGRALQGELDRYEIISTFQGVRITSFQAVYAFVAGQLKTRFHQDDGTNPDLINPLVGNILIAAVAKGTGAIAIPENIDDFEKLDGVSVETY